MSAGYCEVAVALPVAGVFTYAVPPGLAARATVGARVLVPFGGRGVAGVIVRVGVAAPPPDVAARPLTDVIGAPIASELVGLAMWISDYYEAPPGEALRLVQPVGSGESSTRVVAITERGRAALAGEGGALSPRQARLLARLGQSARPLARAEVSRFADELAALCARGLAVEDDARSAARTRPKREKLVALAQPNDAARAATARAPARRAVIEALVAGPAPAATLAATLPGAAAALRELAKAGLVTVTERDVAPTAVAIGDGLTAAVTPPRLNDEQRAAVAAIVGAVGFVAILLHGVTGAGKTEVYLHAIAELRARGKGAIVLVPEISLTPQLAARFRARFGDEVAILHSGLSERDRLSEWTRLEQGDARIAVGARSAVFAPVRDLGIVVVDEEHDGSFKQDEGVRYHGRDVALVRAQRAGAVCVLGSATPSLESYAAAVAGRYQLVTLVERPTGGALPAVQVVDLRVYKADAEAMLSAPLAAALAETVAAGDQAIVFLNRRGFATFVMCRACGHAFRCGACAVSLTYHQAADRLQCHYCGHGERVPERCPKCGADAIDRKGLGTERVAAALTERFPGARVARLDRDVASGAKAEAVLARVARREVDILVGTQMVTKGHDFPGVTLVGVLCADLALGLPDFRASERTFQLLTQVAGRAGRGDRPGRVIIQTYQPDADAIACAARHDYAGFFARESEGRAELDYPPVGRVCAVRIDGTDPHRVADAATRVAALAVAAARAVDDVVLVRGPTPAPLARLRGRSRWQVWLRSRDRAALRRVIRSVLDVDAPGATVAVDVDPLSTL